MKRSTFLKLKLSEAQFITRALLKTSHPVLAHVIPMRRCNLACAYCNESDRTSDPVPLEEMRRRLDKLADLGTSIITLSGGEPMMHPQLDEIVAHIRRRRMIAGLITNGFYLNPKRIGRLNRAGLKYLQISIDNVEPDDVSMKSLKLLEKRLGWLAAGADFHVNINSVIGAGIKNPKDALTVARRALELGFSTTVGVIHDGQGLLSPSAARAQGLRRDQAHRKTEYARLGWFQNNLAEGKPTSGAAAPARATSTLRGRPRHYCSQQRGTPASRSPTTRRRCRARVQHREVCAPYCTVACVHRSPSSTTGATRSRHAERPPAELRDAIGRLLRAD